MEVLQVEVTSCGEREFEIVKKGITEMCLDNRALKIHEFVVAKLNNTVVGFGRIRHYKDCAEICSVGVFEKYRGRGIGKKIVKHLIQNFFNLHTKDLYVVTIIPTYFQKFGFEKTNIYPQAIKDKLIYCISHLYVPEEYIVMKFNHQ